MTCVLRIALVLVVLAASSAAPGAYGQTYPAKPVHLIVPHPGGGGPLDGPARGFAEYFGQSLGQSFVVENRDGAQGIIGADAVAKSEPDGYTLMFTSSSVITLNSLVRKSVPYDGERDFEPVAYTGVIYSLLMANPAVPAKDLKELIAIAKAKPNTITWGTLGTTSAGPLLIGWLKKHSGAQFYMIPYKSTQQALLATVAGDVNVVAYAVGQGAKLVKAGKLKALAIVAGKRLEMLPEVPSTAEQGVDLKFSNWIGLFAPRQVPKQIVERLNRASRAAVAEPAFREKFLHSVGVFEDEMSEASPEQFAAFIRKDRDAYAEAVEAAGIQKQ